MKAHIRTLIRLLTLVFVLFCSFAAMAQQDTTSTAEETVEEKVKTIKEAYRIQNLNQTLKKVDELVHGRSHAFNRLDKQTKAEVLHIGAVSALKQKQSEKAEEYLQDLLVLHPTFLKERPEYQAQGRYKELADQYKVIPELSLGVFMGGGQTQPTVVENPLAIALDGSQNQYAPQWSVQAGLCLEYVLGKRIGLLWEPGLQRLSYSYTRNIPDLSIEPNHSITYLTNAALLRFTFLPRLDHRPYLQVGTSHGLLLNAHQSERQLGSRISTTHLVKRHGFWANVGGGYNFYFQRHRLGIDVRYQMGWTQVNDEATRFAINGENRTFLFDGFDVMEDLALHNWQFSLTWAWIVNQQPFKPVKQYD